MELKRCPECHRFGIEWDGARGHEACIWRDCGWLNREDIDVAQVQHPIMFQRFIDAVARKVR